MAANQKAPPNEAGDSVSVEDLRQLYSGEEEALRRLYYGEEPAPLCPPLDFSSHPFLTVH